MFTLKRWPLLIGGIVLIYVAYVVEPIYGFGTLLASIVLMTLGGRLAVMGFWMDKKKYIAKYGGKTKGYGAIAIIAIAFVTMAPTLNTQAGGPFYTQESLPENFSNGNLILEQDNWSTNSSSDYSIPSSYTAAGTKYDAGNKHLDVTFPKTSTREYLIRNLSEEMNSTTNKTVKWDLKLQDSTNPPNSYYRMMIANRTDRTVTEQGHFPNSGYIAAYVQFVYGTQMGTIKYGWEDYTLTTATTATVNMERSDFARNATITAEFTRNGTSVWLTYYKNYAKMFTKEFTVPSTYIYNETLTGLWGNQHAMTGCYYDNYYYSKVVVDQPLANPTASQSSAYRYTTIFFYGYESKNYTSMNWTMNYNNVLVYNTSTNWSWKFDTAGIYYITLTVYKGNLSDEGIISLEIKTIGTSSMAGPQPDTPNWFTQLIGEYWWLIGLIAVITIIAAWPSGRKRR
jgi:hypothetical protein